MWRLIPTKKFKLKKGAWFIPGFGVFTFQLFWLELVLSLKRVTQKIEFLLLSAAPQLQTAHIAFDLFSSNHPFQRRLFLGNIWLLLLGVWFVKRCLYSETRCWVSWSLPLPWVEGFQTLVTLLGEPESLSSWRAFFRLWGPSKTRWGEASFPKVKLLVKEWFNLETWLSL